MFHPSSFADPTPLTHADASRDVLPRGVESRPSGVVVSDADCCAVGPGLEYRRRHGCSKMCSAFVAGGILNSRRAASPLVRLVAGNERPEKAEHLDAMLLRDRTNNNKKREGDSSARSPAKGVRKSREVRIRAVAEIAEKLQRRAPTDLIADDFRYQGFLLFSPPLLRCISFSPPGPERLFNSQTYLSPLFASGLEISANYGRSIPKRFILSPLLFPFSSILE
ncbi:hypothetical protein TNCV_4293901 [Trichonephila clavipes]|uniref:Uncharacterized protein n=1 Tax=Trichonephila clavipes TaxID=2585209 RepID=A0A8X6RHQ1_TRICX|nr:hypothetical protein TNCV_4293901 [Trichonephila clavipes]